MINIPVAEQEAFQSSAPKTLTLNFSSGDPLSNDDIYMESLLLEQSICEESNLTFGMVYSSHFSVRIFDTGASYTNKRVNPVLSVTVDGTTYTRSLGYYTVKSDRLTSDKLYRDLECYDYLTDVLQTDFASWHNQMPSTYSLKQYRDAFFNRIGLAQSGFTDILDDIGLIKFKVDELSGATVISAILQAYGVFGYLGYDENHNDWRFKYVKPSKTPSITIDDNSYVQGSLNYEDEPIRLISGVKILGWSEDYGEEGSTTIPDVTFGDDVGSMLTFEDNYLIHSLEENPRQSMSHGIYNNVANFNYYPASVEMPVWMGIEPGDVIKIETDRKDIYFPVFKRTIKGISALKDTYEAQGEYELTSNPSAGGVSGTGTSIEQMRESIAELLAQKASIDAQDAAIQANIAANSALTQLSIIEDVAGTLRWISENGEFVETQDVTVQPGTVYFIYENGEYVPITNPDTSKNPSEEGWYILDVTDSQASFIMAHLAVTDAGLWILPVNQLVSHNLVDSAENNLVDSDDNQLVDYGKDDENIHQASGYKVLISGETTDNHPVGVSIYNGSGTLIANYGETATIGPEGGSHVFIDTDSVDIKKGNVMFATFDENGMIVFRTLNGVTKSIATFKADSHSNYPEMILDHPSESDCSTTIDLFDLSFDVPNDSSRFPLDPNSTTGVYKATYGSHGTYYNGSVYPVGQMFYNTDITEYLTSGLWSNIGTIENVPPGTYLFLFGAGFANNSTGYRRVVLNNSLSGTPSPTRYDLTVPAVNGAGTNVHGVRLVKVTNTVDFCIHGFQNSGTQLEVYPYIKAIKIV